MDQYIGQITVIIESDSPMAAQQRLRTLAEGFQTTEADIAFADHNGDIDKMSIAEAECEASLSTGNTTP